MQAELARAVEVEQEKVVEPREVVHVAVRHDDICHAEELARGEGRNFRQVEQKRAPPVPDIHVEPGVPEWSVHRTGLDEMALGDSLDRGALKGVVPHL
jgi:hypothetical protein